MNTVTLDSIFSALGDPTRREIIERLARGPLTISQAASGIAMSQPAISKHVKILEQSGLIRRTVEGRTHQLELTPKAIEAAGSWIERQRQYWNAALDRLDAFLAQTRETKSKKGKKKK